MSIEPTKTIGQKLDLVLEPFLLDRGRIKAQIKEHKTKRAEIDTQIAEMERNLQAVDQAMILAVREGARQEPLLSAAFGLRSASTGDVAIPVAMPRQTDAHAAAASGAPLARQPAAG